MKAALLILATLGFTTPALAVDHVCDGNIGSYALQLTVTYNGLSKLESMKLKVNGKEEFASTSANISILNVGTSKDPLHNTQLNGLSPGSTVALRIPEPDPAKNDYEAYLTVKLANGFEANDAWMTCVP